MLDFVPLPLLTTDDAAGTTDTLSLSLSLSFPRHTRSTERLDAKNSRRMYHERTRPVRLARKSRKKAGREGRKEVSSLSLLLPPSRLLSTLLARVLNGVEASHNNHYVPAMDVGQILAFARRHRRRRARPEAIETDTTRVDCASPDRRIRPLVRRRPV